MKTRVISATVLICLVLACFVLGPYTRVLLLTVAAIFSCHELCGALANKDIHCTRYTLFVYIAGIAAMSLLKAGAVWYCAWTFLAVVVIIFIGIASRHFDAKDTLASLGVIAYPILPFALITRLALIGHWAPVFLIACVSTWVCDSFALFGGKRFGRHKLSPTVSPNKTVEGSVCGAVSSLVVGLIAYFVFEKCFGLAAPLWLCLVTALVASSIGQVGDLAASLFKRFAGIKDYSNLIPGHGGALDRTDSLLFSIPTAYFLFFLAGLV